MPPPIAKSLEITNSRKSNTRKHYQIYSIFILKSASKPSDPLHPLASPLCRRPFLPAGLLLMSPCASAVVIESLLSTIQHNYSADNPQYPIRSRHSTGSLSGQRWQRWPVIDTTLCRRFLSMDVHDPASGAGRAGHNGTVANWSGRDLHLKDSGSKDYICQRSHRKERGGNYSDVTTHIYYNNNIKRPKIIILILAPWYVLKLF